MISSWYITAHGIPDQFPKGHYYFISCLWFYTIVFLSYSEENYIVHTHLHTISDSFTLTLGIKDGEVDSMYTHCAGNTCWPDIWFHLTSIEETEFGEENMFLKRKEILFYVIP